MMDKPICRSCGTEIAPEAQKYLFVTDKDFRPVHPTCLIENQSKEIFTLRAEIEALKEKESIHNIVGQQLVDQNKELRAERDKMQNTLQKICDAYQTPNRVIDIREVLKLLHRALDIKS